MAENANQQVVKFANEEVRQVADRFYQLYFRCKQLLANYNAGDIGTKITLAGAGELIADGSDLDGRTRITGGDVFNLITAATAFVAFVENGAVPPANRIDVITKPHVQN